MKTEFGKFGDVMTKVKRQLALASKSIDETDVRSRAMERQLRSVEQLPSSLAGEVLALSLTPEGNDAFDEGPSVDEDASLSAKAAG